MSDHRFVVNSSMTRLLPADKTPWLAKVRRNAEIRDAQADVGEVIYYVRHRGAVKIGFTRYLVSRMQQLKVPMTSILAIEPGGWHEEQATHERYAGYRIRGEHFRPGPDLLAHINALRAKVSMPPVGVL